MGIWISSVSQVSERFILRDTILRTFLVVDCFAVAVFEHLRVGNTGVSDTTGDVEICAALVGDDLEEDSTS